MSASPWLTSAAQTPVPCASLGQIDTEWLQASGIQKYSYQAEYSQGLEVVSQEPGQGPVLKTDLALECAGFEKPKSDKLTLSGTSL